MSGKVLNIKSMSLLAMLLVVVGLAGCAKNNKSATPSPDATVSAAACAGNIYLEKYHCSLEEVQQAALAGNPDAQYALGYMYYYGIGTVRDQQTAALWIQRAASQGEPLAEKAQKMLAADQQAASSASATTTPTTQAAVSHPQPWLNSQSTASSTQSTATPTATVSDPRLLPGSMPKVATVTSTTAPSANNGTTGTSTVTSSESVNLLKISPHHYTLQLMGSYDKRAIERFIQNQSIEQQSKIYQAEFNSKPWYMLIYGDYDSVSSARMAKNSLPTQLRQLNPWVKSYGLVQEEIRQHRVI